MLRYLKEQAPSQFAAGTEDFIANSLQLAAQSYFAHLLSIHAKQHRYQLDLRDKACASKYIAMLPARDAKHQSLIDWLEKHLLPFRDVVVLPVADSKPTEYWIGNHLWHKYLWPEDIKHLSSRTPSRLRAQMLWRMARLMEFAAAEDPAIWADDHMVPGEQCVCCDK